MSPALKTLVNFSFSI